MGKGIDYSGAITVWEQSTSTKVYIALFTCMVTRAVHLAIVGRNSEDFLRAFIKFASRRSFPSIVYSDNAMNFEAKAQVLALTGQQVQEVVFPVPASFNQAERRALLEAVGIAGVKALNMSDFMMSARRLPVSPSWFSDDHFENMDHHLVCTQVNGFGHERSGAAAVHGTTWNNQEQPLSIRPIIGWDEKK
ncbi:hypothetical protein HAZT_HAZT008223 [Hyalella azteca]|uniref:Integrase catalytic domain-containing protein n=1 Tax=Hyalella azteca TaxID=294128 RepID=A0A6A0HCU7_HYAAZ|nr:hypothetical protein HAZT_HAZT008223 [Hyalella azteca]